jgi:prophage DNA circulation protein
MGQLWSDFLQEGSFDGVSFDFVRAVVEGGNDIDQQVFPNRDGQRNEPRGRKARRERILALFIDDDYPDTMNALLAKLENGGAAKEFVDPIFGSMQMSCESFTVVHDADDAVDSAAVELSLVEDTGTNQGLQAVVSTTPARASALRLAITAVLEAVSSFQATADAVTSYVSQVQGAMAAAASIADSLEATGDQLSAPEIQAQANAALATMDIAIADYSSPEAYDLGAALLAMSAAAAVMAQELIEAKPPLQTHPVLADTNLLSFVHDLYGDTSRVEEVLALNSIPDPSFIPAGFPGGIAAYGA